MESNLAILIFWLQSFLVSKEGVLTLMGMCLFIGIYNHVQIRLKYRVPLLSTLVIKDVGLLTKKRYLIDGNLIGLPDLLFVSPLRVTIVEVKSRHYYQSDDQITCRRSEKERIQAVLYAGMAAKIFRKNVDVRIQYANTQRIINFDKIEYQQLVNHYLSKK
ncbi:MULTISPECIES: hypothetical protein [Vibrio]|uniref:hypothetical protein n=1 Tax=Vibrio TaxID=662 RepID=UPI00078C8591|nr:MULTISPECIES: hypothetical protein [Vibrio]BAU70844.1 hypothetical protein [Vibrio sp. 04Ya108]BBM67587.1 hypothetical protein VA249_42330 [Vibrio alfacsensis]BCN27070.1 hypothetical protein VYA_42620 [Vibrio alfacsensis]